MPKKRDQPEAQQAPAAGDTEERFPQEQTGQFKCPTCERLFVIQDRVDAQTAKVHLQNRGHGTYQDLIPVFSKVGNA